MMGNKVRSRCWRLSVAFFSSLVTRPPLCRFVVTDKVLPLPDGLQIATQVYQSNPIESTATSKTKKRRLFLLLHGWLDNCRSFHRLAPALASYYHDNQQKEQQQGTAIDYYDTKVVAMDFAGHGKSSHVPGGPGVLLDGVSCITQVLQHKELRWSSDDDNDNCTDQVIVIGHSMGAGIAVAFAAAFPEMLDKLVLLEGFGPFPRHERDVANLLRTHVEVRNKGHAKLSASVQNGRKQYTLATAVRARQQTALQSPGDQYISNEAATELVQWALCRNEHDNVENDKVLYSFRHDPRVGWPSVQYLTHGQVEALQRAVRPVNSLLLRAKEGWPIREDLVEHYVDSLRPNVMATLPGSHHFHADPDTWEAVAEHVCKFVFADDDGVVVEDELEQ